MPPENSNEDLGLSGFSGIVPEQKDKEIAVLQDQITGEKDSRKEERFLWAFAIIILVDFLSFPSLSWFKSLLMFILEFVFLILLGRQCGVDDVYVLTQRAIDAVVKLGKRGSNND